MTLDPTTDSHLPHEDARSEENLGDWAELWAQAGWLKRFARQLGSEPNAAEDAVQETLLSAREALGKGGVTASMRGWLRTAVKRRVGTGRRSEARRRVRERLAAKAEAQPGDPLQALEREELGARLAAAIAELPVQDRELIALRYAAGMGPSAIAASKSMTPAAVSSRLKRIHLRIREQLERDEITPFGGRFAAPFAAVAAIVMKKSIAVPVAVAVLSAIALTWRAGQDPSAPRAELTSIEDVTEGLVPVPDAASSADLARVALDSGRALAEIAPEPGEALSEAAAVDVGTTGSLRLEVTWGDGTPAENVAVLLGPRDLLGAPATDRWKVTDAAGVIELSGLSPGDYSVEADRGGSVQTKVVASESAVARLALNEGVDVRGTVRDPEGRPIAGASIIATSWRYDWRGSRVVGTTDVDGSFMIRSVLQAAMNGFGGRALGATAAGWAPSALFDVSRLGVPSSESASLREVELTLSERGADAWGTVTDSDGSPLQGVMVAVGSGSLMAMTRTDHPNELAKPRVTSTDAEGRYRLEGIAPGVHVVAAHFAGWPISSTEAEFVEGTRVHQDFVLTPGVTVFGVARLQSGEPAAGATLMALPEPFEDGFSDQGPVEGGSPFAYPQVNADASGHFEIGPLPPGTLHLYASLGASFLTPRTGEDPVFEGAFQETLAGTSGDRMEWNPELTLGLAIRGRAVYADGTPFRHAWVTATDLDGEDFSTNATEDGTFVIPNLKSVPYRVTLQMPHEAPNTESVAAFYDIVPPAQDVRFHLGYSPQPKAPEGTLRVRVHDSANLGASLSKGKIVPVVQYETSGSWGTLEADEEGLFETKLAPGAYRVDLGGYLFRVVRGQRIEISSNETLDLGTLETAPLGTLAIKISRPDGFTGAVSIHLNDYPGRDGSIPPEVSTTSFDNVSTGECKVRISGEGILDESVTTEILPGARAELTVQLRPAAQVSIEATLRQPRGFRRIALRVTDVHGETCYQRARRESHITEWPYAHKVALAVGTYTVHLKTADGQVATSTLVVESTDAQDPFRIHAR